MILVSHQSGFILSQQVFWKVYTQHNRGHIGHYMSRYKIGEVTPEDMAVITARTFYDESFYEKLEKKMDTFASSPSLITSH